jgi:mannosyltransferase
MPRNRFAIARGSESSSLRQAPESGSRHKKFPPAALLSPVVALALLTALAAVIRISFIGTKSLYLDEANSVAIAQLHLAELWRMIASREANMALYFVFLHYWIHLGTGEFMLRIPSAAFSIATVPVLYALAKRLFDTRVALIAALLLAINAFHLESAQNARSYSLLLLLVTSSDLLFLRATESPDIRRCAAYVAAAVLAVYTHFFALLVVAAQAAFLVVARHPQKVRRRLYASATVIILSSLPIILFIIFRNTGQLDWVPRTRLSMISYLFISLSGGGHGSLAITGGLAIERVLRLLYTVLLAAGLVICAKRRQATRHPAFDFLATGLFLPIASAVIISAAFQPLFVYHYLEICLPPFLILVAAGVSFMVPRPLIAGSLVLITLLGLYEDISFFKYYIKADFRDTVNYIAAHHHSADGAVLYPPDGRWPFSYYCSHLTAGLTCPEIAFPGLNTRFWIGGPYVSDSAPVLPDRDFLVNLPCHYGRIWLVLLDEDAFSLTIKGILAEDYGLSTAREFPGLTLLLYGGRGRQRPCAAGMSGSAEHND